MFWYDPELPKKFPGLIKFPLSPSRDYFSITLSGDRKSDENKLDLSRVRLGEMLKQKNSAKGIRYHFEENAEYWSFIKALDICQVEGAKTYLPYENDLWVNHMPDDTTEPLETFVCGTSDFTQILPSVGKETNYFDGAWQSSKPIVAGAVCLTLWSLFRLKRHVWGR